MTSVQNISCYIFNFCCEICWSPNFFGFKWKKLNLWKKIENQKTFFVSVFRAMSEIFSISFFTSTKLKPTLFGLSSRAWVPGNCAGHHEDGLSLPAFHQHSNKELPFPSPVSLLRLQFRSRVRKTHFRFSCYSGLLRGHLQEVFLWRAAFVSRFSNACGPWSWS